MQEQLNTPIILPENHITMVSEMNFRAICAPILANTDITFVEYSHFYKDGSMVDFSTDMVFLNELLRQALWPTIEEFALGDRYSIVSHVMPLPEAFELDRTKYLKDIELAKEFSIYHRFYILNHYPDYYEIIGFATKEAQPDILQFYINNTHQLEKYLSYVREKSSDLMQKGAEDRIIINNLSGPYHDNEKVAMKKRQFSISIPHGQALLTWREAQCLYHLLQGKTAKQTGVDLCISPRTVESYLDHLKVKVQVRTKLEVVNKVSQDDFFRQYKDYFDS